jgi:hypothetical protein
MGENIGYSPLNNIQEKYMLTQIQNLNKQVQLSVEINTLMDQSLKLMEIVNENQKRVNDIKEEQEQLQLHIDNATDQIEA